MDLSKDILVEISDLGFGGLLDFFVFNILAIIGMGRCYIWRLLLNEDVLFMLVGRYLLPVLAKQQFQETVTEIKENGVTQ
jgi:hypothetical protein